MFTPLPENNMRHQSKYFWKKYTGAWGERGHDTDSIMKRVFLFTLTSATTKHMSCSVFYYYFCVVPCFILLSFLRWFGLASSDFLSSSSTVCCTTICFHVLLSHFCFFQYVLSNLPSSPYICPWPLNVAGFLSHSILLATDSWFWPFPAVASLKAAHG